MQLSVSQRGFLSRATSKYERAMTDEVLGYLDRRGISEETAATFRLGYVREPEPGHENMAGMLAIPYLTRAGVVNIKARCIHDHDCKDAGHPKYQGPPGAGTFLYNVGAFTGMHETIAVTEGELDTIALSVAGVPSVGVPGVDPWKKNKHWPFCFTGYKRVMVFADNDTRHGERNPGMRLAKAICDSIEVATVITLPENEDTNTCLVKYGENFLRKKAGLA